MGLHPYMMFNFLLLNVGFRLTLGFPTLQSGQYLGIVVVVPKDAARRTWVG